MKVTIVVPDNYFIVEGALLETVDLSSLPGNIHAIQWQGDKGEVEYNDGSVNTFITSLAPYEHIFQDYNIQLDDKENPVYTDEELYEQALYTKLAELKVEFDKRLAEYLPVTKSKSKDKILSRAIRLLRKESQGRATQQDVVELDFMEALDQHMDLVATLYDNAEDYLEESERTQEELENYDVASDPSWPTMEG